MKLWLNVLVEKTLESCFSPCIACLMNQRILIDLARWIRSRRGEDPWQLYVRQTKRLLVDRKPSPLKLWGSVVVDGWVEL